MTTKKSDAKIRKTMWQVGDKVYSRFDHSREGTVVKIDFNAEPYYRNAFEMKATKPTEPLEWDLVRFADGEERSFLCVDLVQFV